MTKLSLLMITSLALAYSLPASAKLYKWVDNQGVTHYGETVPPEYADKNRVEINKEGRTVQKTDATSAEDLRNRAASDNKVRSELNALQEQQRRDKALINTYTTEKEIDLARDRNIQQIDARINSISFQLKILANKINDLQKEAEGIKQAGKKIPKSLTEDLAESQTRQDKLQIQLDKAKSDKAALEARFDADKARFKELKGQPQ